MLFLQIAGTKSNKDLQVPEILVVMQVFVIDGGEAALVGDVSVIRQKCASEDLHVDGRKQSYVRNSLKTRLYS